VEDLRGSTAGEDRNDWQAGGQSILVLGETLTPNQIAGALIIAAGLVLIDGRLLQRLGRRGASRSAP
jgi:hypothetical protein